MKKSPNPRKLKVNRDTLRRLTDDDSGRAIGGVLCTHCQTTCATCVCTRTARCTSG